jgi:phosphinothricin acetyltransferase
MIRAATSADAAAIAAIYNEGLRGGQATFETVDRTPDDVRLWLSEATPFLVDVTNEGHLHGWIRASAYRPRACYAGIAEFSVYVAAAARGQGVGHRLMEAFLPACAAAGYWKVLSRIFPENAASLALCARHGFRVVGTYEKHGQLHGQWRDVVIVERTLPIGSA